MPVLFWFWTKTNSFNISNHVEEIMSPIILGVIPGNMVLAVRHRHPASDHLAHGAGCTLSWPPTHQRVSQTLYFNFFNFYFLKLNDPIMVCHVDKVKYFENSENLVVLIPWNWMGLSCNFALFFEAHMKMNGLNDPTCYLGPPRPNLDSPPESRFLLSRRQSPSGGGGGDALPMISSIRLHLLLAGTSRTVKIVWGKNSYIVLRPK